MGIARANFRADADDAGRVARPDPGSLSCRRLQHEHHHTADAVLPPRRGVLPAIRKKHRDRNTRRDDVAIFNLVPRDVDSLPANLLRDWCPTRHTVQLHLSLIEQDSNVGPLVN